MELRWIPAEIARAGSERANPLSVSGANPDHRTDAVGIPARLPELEPQERAPGAGTLLVLQELDPGVCLLYTSDAADE